MKFTHFTAVQVRIARPTDNFDEVIRFYEQGLGLQRITEFEGHRGYKGVIIGIPDASYHLEFTKHVDGSPCPAPTKDNLLVFYIPNQAEILVLKNRLEQMGYPYWKERGVTIEDPDGWRIVLMNTEGI